jgi:glycosyltransferase involved in cell wall biosynthesis
MAALETLVSVIIPVFNGERFVGRTIDFALGQTYSPLEIIVVDDGSTDQTSAIITSAADRDSRIRVFRAERTGAAMARNIAIGHAHGSFIAPLDADDLWHPDKIAQQMAVMRVSSSKVGVVYCWSLDIDEYDFIIPPVRNKCTVQGNVLEELAARNNFLENGSAPLIRRSCLERVGGYDADYSRGSEDWKLYLSLAEICEFGLVPAHLVGYRRLNTSMSTDIRSMEGSIETITQWIIDKWPDLPPEIKRRMFCNTNRYLAHKALTANNFVEAARYQLKSFKFEPFSLLTPPNLTFVARLLSRALGIKRAAIPFWSEPVSFTDFCREAPFATRS